MKKEKKCLRGCFIVMFWRSMCWRRVKKVK